MPHPMTPVALRFLLGFFYLNPERPSQLFGLVKTTTLLQLGYFSPFLFLFGSTAVLGSFSMLDRKGLQVYVLYNMHM